MAVVTTVSVATLVTVVTTITVATIIITHIALNPVKIYELAALYIININMAIQKAQVL